MACLFSDFFCELDYTLSLFTLNWLEVIENKEIYDIYDNFSSINCIYTKILNPLNLP